MKYKFFDRPLSYWSVRVGVTEDALRKRIKKTGSIDKAILKPYETVVILNDLPTIIDKSFEYIIVQLNQLGFRTKFSCAGHKGYDGIPYIVFSSDTIPYGLPTAATLVDTSKGMYAVYMESYFDCNDINYEKDLQRIRLSLIEWIEKLKRLTDFSKGCSNESK